MSVFSNTYLLLMLFLGHIMLLSLGTLTLQYHGILHGTTTVFAAVLIVLSFFIGITSFRRIFQADIQALVLQKQEVALHEMESTLRLIRYQRHDIANHLHTIYALLQMGREQHAKKYVNQVELATTNAMQAAKLESPEVAAFLQSKLGQAMAKNISFNIEVLASMHDCAAKPYFLVIILGNLLDNAFEAVEDLPISKRLVELEISQQEGSYRLAVSNAGPVIDKNLHCRVFEPGYSTKGPGRGYGLAIVRETIINHGGSIEINNNPTTFTVILPKEGGGASDPQTGSKAGRVLPA